MTTATKPVIPVAIKIDGREHVVECSSNEIACSLITEALAHHGDLSLIEFGQWLNQHYQPGFLVGERPVTMFESNAISMACHEDRRAQATEHGCCCDEGPESNGRCREGLIECPLFELAKNMVFRTWRE